MDNFNIGLFCFVSMCKINFYKNKKNRILQTFKSLINSFKANLN